MAQVTAFVEQPLSTVLLPYEYPFNYHVLFVVQKGSAMILRQGKYLSNV